MLIAEVLMSVLIACIVAGVVCWIVQLIPMPSVVKQIALILCAIVLFVWIMNMLGIVGHPRIIRFR